MPKDTKTPDVDPDLGSAADTVIDTVTLRQQAALETIETTGAAIVEGLTRVQREMTDFVSERVRQDMETQQELLRCKSLDEVRSIQARFFKIALDQYSAEATRLMRIGGELMAKSAERVD